MRRLLLAPIVLVILLAPAYAGEGDEADKPETPGTEIAGRVLDPGGAPVAGARVLGVSAEAKPARTPRSLFPSAAASPRQLPVAEATTDDGGRFTIEVRGPAPWMLRADAEGFAPGRLAEVKDAGASVTVRLSAGETVNGQVLDRTTGKPLAGADVEARPTKTQGFADPEHPDRFLRQARTDEDGRFRIEHLEPSYYRLTAIADGYTRAPLGPVEIGLSAPPEPAHFYLEPGVVLRGRVLGADGKPLAGAHVDVTPERLEVGAMMRWGRTGDLTEKTGEDGRFAIRGVPPAPAYRLQARHEDLAPTWLSGVEVRPGGESAALEIRLRPGTRLTAKLVADSGPFEGEVSAVLSYTDEGVGRPWPRVSPKPEQIELKEGRLTIALLPPGKATLELTPQGHAAVERKDLVLPEDRPLELGEILVDPGLRITGKVVGDDGKPLADASIEITAMGPGRFERKTTSTAGDGSFAAGGLPELGCTVNASADGYGPASIENVEPGGEPLRIELERAAAIRGRVLAGDPPRPLRGFSVTPLGTAPKGVPFPMQAAMQARARMSFSDAGGEFRVDGLRGDTYALKVEAAGFVASRIEKVKVEPGETANLGDIVLERGATLHGMVSERDGGRPVAGAAVSLEEPGLFNLGAFMDFDKAEELTRPDGSFTLRGLPPGSHTVKVRHERFSPGTQEVEIAAGVPPAPLSVELGHGGAIEGTYRDRDGKPVQGGMVMAMLGFTPSPDAMTSTDELGHFRIENLPPGTYRVMAMGNPLEAQGDPEAMMSGMQMQTAEVVDGKTAVVNLPAQTGGIRVSGVVRKGSRPLESRMFWVRMAADGTNAEDFSIGVSDESGSYQIRLSEPGEYRVSVEPMGRADERERSTTTLRVEVPGDADQITRDLMISDVALSGTVLDGDTGMPLRDVQIFALEHREDRSLAESIGVGAATSDEHGGWRLEGLAEGEYRLVFSKEGFGARTLGPIEVEDGEQDGLNMALLPASPVRVKVVDENGNAVEGALVTSFSGPLMAVSGGSGQTDMNGEATLGGLADGTHDLGVLATGLAPAVVPGVAVPPDADDPTLVTLRRGAPLTVRVLDAEERPVSKATVRVREVEGDDLTPLLQIGALFRGRGMITGPAGELVVPGLRAGRYEVEVRWEEFATSEKVRVRLDRENVVEIDLR